MAEGVDGSCSLKEVMEEHHAYRTEVPVATAGDDATERARFAALYRATVDEVYQFVHRRCQDTEMAEDLTQDVFMSVVRSGRPIAEFSIGWLITAARHQLIDVARREARHSAKLRLLRGGLDGVDLDPAPVDRLMVEEALARIRVDHRLVLSLHYLDGLTVAELADRLGRTPKAIEGLITRARRNLHRELEQSDA